MARCQNKKLFEFFFSLLITLQFFSKACIVSQDMVQCLVREIRSHILLHDEAKKKREKEILSLTYFTQYDNLRSIHVAAKGIYFVLFVAENYSTVYMYHIFIHSSVDGHLGCFHVLTIVNSAAVYIGMHVSF